MYYSLLSPKVFLIIISSSSSFSSFVLFLNAKGSRVNFKIHRNWSIVINSTRYDYNDNEGKNDNHDNNKLINNPSQLKLRTQQQRCVVCSAR